MLLQTHDLAHGRVHDIAFCWVLFIQVALSITTENQAHSGHYDWSHQLSDRCGNYASLGRPTFALPQIGNPHRFLASVIRWARSNCPDTIVGLVQARRIRSQRPRAQKHAKRPRAKTHIVEKMAQVRRHLFAGASKHARMHRDERNIAEAHYKSTSCHERVRAIGRGLAPERGSQVV